MAASLLLLRLLVVVPVLAVVSLGAGGASAGTTGHEYSAVYSGQETYDYLEKFDNPPPSRYYISTSLSWDSKVYAAADGTITDRSFTATGTLDVIPTGDPSQNWSCKLKAKVNKNPSYPLTVGPGDSYTTASVGGSVPASTGFTGFLVVTPIHDPNHHCSGYNEAETGVFPWQQDGSEQMPCGSFPANPAFVGVFSLPSVRADGFLKVWHSTDHVVMKPACGAETATGTRTIKATLQVN